MDASCAEQLEVVDRQGPDIGRDVVGANDFLHGVSTDPSTVGLTVSGSDIEVRLTHPASQFPAIVALSTAVVQILYAFGPGLLGILRDAFGGYGVPLSVCMALNVVASALTRWTLRK